MQLFIGNKNYSSWSMRPWVLMQHFGVRFEEIKLRFDAFTAHSQFKQGILSVNPVGKVPTLRHGELVVWDTLAIAEYLAELYPEKKLWPTHTAARARARSICAEMHSGFGHLRSHFPMNIEARLPDVGQLVLRDKEGVRADLARLQSMWNELLDQNDGPYLFGDFTIADAYFAPVCMRLITYAPPLDSRITAYVAHIANTPAVKAWVHDAQQEADFIDFEEPYRLSR